MKQEFDGRVTLPRSIRRRRTVAFGGHIEAMEARILLNGTGSGSSGGGGGSTSGSGDPPEYSSGGDDDVVAIYDNDDHAISADDMQEMADDYHDIGASDWAEFVQVLEDYVEESGLIDTLYIIDHGITYTSGGVPTGDYAQQFGDTSITPEMFDDISHLLEDDAVIILGGCNVANDSGYIQDLADAVSTTIIASDANVTSSPNNWFDPDFYSQGDWEVIDPTGESNGVSPDDYDLWTDDSGS